MIRYVKRVDLNVEKYDVCVERSLNSRIYAYSWYLDIVADNWDALILNDYEAVMPLPWRSKYFIKYIYPPCWTQQLGIFASFKITSDWTLKFVKSIPKKFKKVTIAFNSENDCTGLKVKKKNNYILDLNRPYEELYKNYRKGRKAKLKQAKRSELYIKEIPIKTLIEYSKMFYKNIGFKELDYLKLSILCEELILKNRGKLEGVFAADGELLGGVLFLFEDKRITYLLSAFSPKGKNHQATCFLIDKKIKQFVNRDLLFDFEGSMVDGIAFFFKTFGSSKENYSSYTKNKFL
ncbi:hypothetical protein [Urechidicola sp. KH5]